MAFKAEVKDGKLVLTMDLDKEGHISSTGKTTLHATASDKVDIPGIGECRFSASVYSKPKA